MNSPLRQTPSQKAWEKKKGFGECQGGRPTVQSLTSPYRHMLIHPSVQQSIIIIYYSVTVKKQSKGKKTTTKQTKKTPTTNNQLIKSQSHQEQK